MGKNDYNENIFVLDIETVVDDNVAYKLCKIDKNSSLETRRKAIEEYHFNITDGKNSFPRQLFHRIVCISFLDAKIHFIDGKEEYEIKKIGTFSSFEATEEEMLQSFWNYMEKRKPRIITFNGKTFDLPVLKYRAMKYGIEVKWFFDFGDKWENYNNKYSNSHIDLIDIFSDYGSSARIKMSEVCALFNIPCKIDGINGGKVEPMFDAGDFQNIISYCENDVKATYLLYLHFMKFAGKISKIFFDKTRKDFAEFLNN